MSVSELRPLRHAGVMDSLVFFSNVILLTLRDNSDRISEHVTGEVDLDRGIMCGACRLPSYAGLIYKAWNQRRLR